MDTDASQTAVTVAPAQPPAVKKEEVKKDPATIIREALSDVSLAIVQNDNAKLVAAAEVVVNTVKGFRDYFVDRDFVEPLTLMADRLVVSKDPRYAEKNVALATEAYRLALVNVVYHDNKARSHNYNNSGRFKRPYFSAEIKNHILSSIEINAHNLPDASKRVDSFTFVVSAYGNQYLRADLKVDLKQKACAGIVQNADALPDPDFCVAAFKYVASVFKDNDDPLKEQALEGMARHAPKLLDSAARVEAFKYIVEETRNDGLKQTAFDGIEKYAPELPTPLARVTAYEFIANGETYSDGYWKFRGTSNAEQKRRAMNGMLDNAEGVLPDMKACMRAFKIVARRSDDIDQKQRAIAGIMKYKNGILNLSELNDAFIVASENVCADTPLQREVEAEFAKLKETFCPKEKEKTKEGASAKKPEKNFGNLWGWLPGRING